ncbi:hypothetical protein [Candidatus Electrothrix sp.]
MQRKQTVLCSDCLISLYSIKTYGIYGLRNDDNARAGVIIR